MQRSNASPLRLAPADSPSDTGYVPGVCNIGPYELARRRRGAIVGFVVAGLIAVALVAIDAPTFARAFVLLPLWGAFVSALQVRRRFCVGFAMGALRNFGPDRSAQERVIDPAAIAADRRTAARMIADAFLLALAVAVVFVLLPI
jgi:hypothetical protein